MMNEDETILPSGHSPLTSILLSKSKGRSLQERAAKPAREHLWQSAYSMARDTPSCMIWTLFLSPLLDLHPQQAE